MRRLMLPFVGFVLGSLLGWIPLRAQISGPVVLGGTCTNQAVTAISVALGVPTCTTITSAYTSGLATTAGTLAQFAATTSAQLAGVISDETGSDLLVFATSPRLTTPTITTSALFANGQGFYDGGADIIEQYRSTNGQTWNLYNSRTDSSNYERLALTWASNIAIVDVQKAGSGSQRTLSFRFANAEIFRLSAATIFSLQAHDFNNNNVTGVGILKFSNSNDLILTYAAAATLQLGANVNGAAVSQILQAANGITGTDKTGGNFTVASGKGTGLGAVSSILLQTPTVLTTGTTAQTNTTRLTINSTSITALTSYTAPKFLGNGTAPAVTNTSANSCGTTAATLVGSDTAGKVTVGATAGTSCTITFTTVWGNAPSCAVSNETTANLLRATSTTSTVILAGTMVAGDVLAYTCLGY